MRKSHIITFMILLVTYSGFSQLNKCDSLYMQFNLDDISLRTSQLVINQLKDKCVEEDDPFFTFSSISKPTNTKTTTLQVDNNSGWMFQTEAQRYAFYNKMVKENETNYTINQYKVQEKVRNEYSGYQDGLNTVSRIIDAQLLTVAVLAPPSVVISPFIGVVKEGLTWGIGNAIAKLEQTALKSSIAALAKAYNIEKGNNALEQECGANVNCRGDKISAWAGFNSDGTKSNWAWEVQLTETQKSEGYSDFEANTPIPSKTKAELIDQFKVASNELTTKKNEFAQKYLSSGNNYFATMENSINDIKESQDEMKNRIGDVELGIRSLVQDNALIKSGLKKVNDEVEQLMSDNIYVQNYIFGQMGGTAQVQQYENCLNPESNIGCPSNILKEINAAKGTDFRTTENYTKAKKRETLETIQYGVEWGMAALQIGADISRIAGVKGEDAANIAAGMFYAQNAASTITSGAKIWATSGVASPQDYANVINGVANIIGGPGEAKPSPELAAIMQLREEMHGRFDILDEKLDTLLSNQLKIHQDLSKQLKRLSELNQYNFNQVQVSLNDVLNNQDLMKSQLWELLNNDLDKCNQPLNLAKNTPEYEGMRYYKNYIDLYQTFSTEVSGCVNGIRDKMNLGGGFYKDGKVDLVQFTVDDTDSEYYKQERKNFQKAARFFEWFYGSENLDNLNQATEQLLFPSTNTENNLYNYMYFKSLSFEDVINNDEVLSQTFYLDAFNFSRFVEIYSTFYPYMEFQQRNAPIAQEFEDFISFSKDPNNNALKVGRKSFLYTDVQLLNQISNVIQAQQVLLSGHMLLRPLYSVIYKNQFNSNISFGVEGATQSINSRHFAIDMLNNNPTLARNFAIYVLRRNYEMSEYNYVDSTKTEINPRERIMNFYNHAYTGLDKMTFSYTDSTQTLGIDTVNSTLINTAILKANSKYDLLDFYVQDGFNSLKIEYSNNPAACGTANCIATIPIPNFSEIELDQILMSDGYHNNFQSKAMVEKLYNEVHYNDFINNSNWFHVSQLKQMIYEN
jgi:hypothetical protein